LNVEVGKRMKITAQEEYGLRCLLQLARVPQGQVVRVRDIAKLEGLSNAYVEKLLRLLSQASLTQSVRGSAGGYTLAKPAADITLGAIVRALGVMPATDIICQSYTGNEDECVHLKDCGIRSVWAGLTAYIQSFLDATTLVTLLDPENSVAERLAQRTRFVV